MLVPRDQPSGQDRVACLGRQHHAREGTARAHGHHGDPRGQESRRALHVGQPAALLLPVTTETIGSAKVYVSSAANKSLYGFDSQTQALQITGGRLAFDVPSTLTAQPVKVTVSALLALAIPVCTGPSECSATFVIGNGAPYAADGTPDPPLALSTDLVP
jgi:hypothetical protein